MTLSNVVSLCSFFMFVAHAWQPESLLRSLARSFAVMANASLIVTLECSAVVPVHHSALSGFETKLPGTVLERSSNGWARTSLSLRIKQFKRRLCSVFNNPTLALGEGGKEFLWNDFFFIASWLFKTCIWFHLIMMNVRQLSRILVLGVSLKSESVPGFKLLKLFRCLDLIADVRCSC